VIFPFSNEPGAVCRRSGSPGDAGAERYHSLVTVWIKRLSSFEEEAEADAAFYRAMSPEERVAILEQLRAEWNAAHDESDQRLRRVVRRVSGA
jgi:hypothetical protein